ncbi:MAG: hypothetical protein ABI432_02810 [Flavobacteriales bacterium]
MRRSRCVLLFLPTLLFAACTYDKADELAEPAGACDTTNVTYTGTIVPIMITRCALPGCHVPGGNGTGDLTTYAGVQNHVLNGKLLAAVQHTTGAIPMPPDGSMIPMCDILRISAWIQQGAPNN